MINIREELANYPPIDLAAIEESGREIPDNIRNSIILYNKAIESIRINSEDIAIIELKKTIAMNPGFCEAMNLLGLCYILVNDHAKAAEVFQRVINTESNSIKALEYMKSMGNETGSGVLPVKPKKKNKPEPEVAKSHAEAVKRPGPEKARRFGRRDAFKYFAGFVAGALVVLAVNFTPGKTQEDVGVIDALENEKKQLGEELDEYRSRFSKLEEEYKILQNNLDTANTAVGYHKSVIKLYEAESLFYQKKYENAADLLVLLKVVEFKGVDLEKFDKLCADVMPHAAKAAYEEGVRLVSPEMKFSEALEKLNKVPLYRSDFEKMDAVLYYTGKCYQQLDDSRNAVATFQKLIEQYPRSSYVKWAHIRLQELTSEQ